MKRTKTNRAAPNPENAMPAYFNRFIAMSTEEASDCSALPRQEREIIKRRLET
jgi:hypothetical protein